MVKPFGFKSYVYDNADVSNLVLAEHSKFKQECSVDSGIVINSLIQSNTIVAGTPQIINSTLEGCRVTGNTIIENSFVGAGTVIRDNSTIRNSTIIGAIIIEGHAELTGVNLTYISPSFERMRIHQGVWTGRPPEVFDLHGYPVTECIDGCSHIGCWFRPLSWWLSNGKKVGRRYGWTQDDIDLLESTFTRWSIE